MLVCQNFVSVKISTNPLGEEWPLDPIKLVITNYPEGQVEELHGENNPEVEGGEGARNIPFSNELWIERDDFMEEPPKKFFRLGPGLSVRLKHAYIVQCHDFVKDEQGNVKEIHCTYVPDSKSGEDTSGLKVKGTIHWVSVPHAKEAEVLPENHGKRQR